MIEIEEERIIEEKNRKQARYTLTPSSNNSNNSGHEQARHAVITGSMTHLLTSFSLI